MPSQSQEKPVYANIRLSADFTDALISGESVQSGNIVVTATNSLTDASAPAILLGSPSLSGNVVSQDVTGGAEGEIYTITFNTGLTNLGLQHVARMYLVITNDPASENILCPRDDLKRLLKISDTSDDALLDDLLLSASRYFRTRTQRDFNLQRYIEKIYIQECHDNYRVKLKHYPLLAIDQIDLKYMDGQVYISYTDTSKFDFLIEGYAWFNDFTPFALLPDYNEIVYRAGYAKIPEDIREAVKRLAMGFYRAIGHEGLTAERIGDYSWQKSTIRELLPPRIRAEVDDTFVESIVRRYQRIDL